MSMQPNLFMVRVRNGITGGGGDQCSYAPTPGLAVKKKFAARMRRASLRSLALIIAGAPALLPAQYSEIKMGEYLHYAVAAANGGVYAGIDGIGYTTIFGTPSVFEPSNGWVDLPGSMGFNTNSRYYGQPKGISHDGTVVAGYMVGVATNGTSIQYAAYWVNGVESLVPAPPDDPTPTIMSATGVSGDGTTLIVQDQTGGKTESYVFKIAGGTFTSLGFLGGTNQQTYATAINKDGTIVAGYYNLDDGDIHGFMWDATNGLTDMGIPASHPNTYYLEPTCISDDGTTVFGQLTEFNGWVGFRYNTTTGFQDTRRHCAQCLHGGWNRSGRNRIHVFPGRLVGWKRRRLSGPSPFRQRHPAGAGDHRGAGHNFTRWLCHHGARPGCLFDRPDLVWHLAGFPAGPLENGGDSCRPS